MADRDQATRTLHEWWQKKRGNRAMPARADLDPAELKPILADIVLIDVTAAPGGAGHRFTFRLAGTEIDSRFGLKLTGLSLDEIPFGETRDLIRAQYETAIAERRPVFCSHNAVIGGVRYVEYDRLVVPLYDATETVTTLLAAVDFHCAYLVEQGREPLCTRARYCDWTEPCLTRRASD